MKYFVYYEDGYFDCGGVGLEEFETKKDAIIFIEKRLSDDKSRDVSEYKVIEGKVKTIEVIETVSRLLIK